MVRFVEKRIDEPTWISQPSKFGFIPNLHLEMLENKEKLKPNAPIIPDSTYQNMHIIEEKIAEPIGGQKPKIEEMKSVSEEEKGTESADSVEFNSDEEAIRNQFAESEEVSEQASEEEVQETHTIETVEEEPEASEETKEAKNKVERRHLIKKCREHNIDFEETDSLQTLRMSYDLYLADKQKTETHSGSVTVNKFFLSLLFMGGDAGISWYDKKLEGFGEYQMKLMPMYEQIIEKMDDTQIAELIFSLPPALQLTIAVGLSSAGYVAMKKWDLGEKIQNMKIFEAFVPGTAKAIDAMTQAATAESQPAPRSRRGPTVRAEDIDKMEA